MEKEGKNFIKRRLNQELHNIEKQKDADLISKEQAEKESKKDIVGKSKDKSILPKEDE
jgi:hypothetical protein